MADQFGPKRPLGVTLVAALAIISGAFDIIGGIVLLAGQGDAELAELLGGTGMLVTVATVSILVGVATIIIAVGLLRGNAVSRIAATVLQVFSLAMSVWVGIAEPSSLGTEIPSALLAIAVLVLLWTGEASRYFRGLAPDEPNS